MKLTIEMTPEEFKQLSGADKLEQMMLDQIKDLQKQYTNPYSWPSDPNKFWSEFGTWTSESR